jgi:hypothetical protein
MDTDHIDEAALTRLMTTVTADLTPPVQTIIDNSLVRAVRMRRLMRMRRAGAVAGAVVVAAGLVLGVGALNRSAGIADHAAATPKPTGKLPTLPPAVPMQQYLLTEPPAVVPLDFISSPTYAPGDGNAEWHPNGPPLSYVDGEYKGVVEYTAVQPHASGDVYSKQHFDLSYEALLPESFGQRPPRQCPLEVVDKGQRPAGALPTSCAVQRFADGSLAVIQVTGTDKWGLYEDQVDLFRADGLLVHVASANGTHSFTGGASKVYAAKPVMLPDKLLKLAEGPMWLWLEQLH